MPDNVKQGDIVFTSEGFSVLGRYLFGAERGDEDPIDAMYDASFRAKPVGISPEEVFLISVGELFVSRLTRMPELELVRERAVVEPDEADVERAISRLPFSLGSEHVGAEWLASVFRALGARYARDISGFDGSVSLYLSSKSSSLRTAERVFFHLVENKDGSSPFAFLATYASCGENGRVRHLPLRAALTEFSDDRPRLLSMLSCLERASEVSQIVSSLIDSGEMFHTLRFSVDDAYSFLKDVEAIEDAGIACRVPNWWRRRHGAVRGAVRIGSEQSALGAEELISAEPVYFAHDVELTASEIEELIAGSDGLAMIKGRWIEVDRAKLRALLDEMADTPDRVSFFDAMRRGLSMKGEGDDLEIEVTNGEWLAGVMRTLRAPSEIEPPKVPRSFVGRLREYQTAGFAWLSRLADIGLGACLADDMGLGKTAQVLAFLERMRTTKKGSRALLVVPTSLLGNWETEIEKFVPKMTRCVMRGAKSQLNQDAFLTIATYGTVPRASALKSRRWTCLILDEAQAVKNPSSARTKSIKEIPADHRIAMTGTPIENDLSNLWSIFDLIDRGLLGTMNEFKRFCKKLEERPDGWSRLRRMTAPFLLRRLKTDREIIRDLPDKIEMTDSVTMTRKQAALYRAAVDALAGTIETAGEGIARSGAVLGAIMKLKQICNHPDQYLGQADFSPRDSGKFEVLEEICGTIRDKRERALVFTQFREMTEPLASYLQTIFGRPGLVLHGGTPARRRAELVASFQGTEYVPFMVLSIKAGGVGLNLTAANHVIHFDRWWNPAVEEQATDRAFRIGQRRDVIVHKLVCKGSIEEKIDDVISRKRGLASSVIGANGEKYLSSLSDRELIEAMRLDA